MRRIRAALLLAIVLSFVVAACGGAEKTPSARTAAPTAGGQATQAAPTAQATATPAPTPTAAVVAAGELIVSLAGLGSRLYPGLGDPGTNSDYLSALYDPLLAMTPDGEANPKAGLIISWAPNADSTAWTFKLRNNLLFHNGERATSQDIAFGMELVLLDPNAPFSGGGTLRKSVAKLETPDEDTLVVTLQAPEIFWYFAQMSQAASVVTFPRVVISKKYASSVGADGYNKAPLSSGPYKFKSIAIGDRVIVEAPDKPHFYYGTPRIKTLTFVAIPEETTRVSLLRTGAVDVAPVGLASERGLSQAGLRVVALKGVSGALFWNGQYPNIIPGKGPNPLANVTVRKALFWHAIDRQAIVDSFFSGRGTPSMDYPIPDRELYAFDKPLPIPAYDPAKAKAMLAEAGFAAGFELDVYLLTEASASPEVMEAVAVYWERIGIKVKRIPYTGITFTTALLAVYKKDGFSTPTIAGLFSGGTGGRSLNSSAALLQHNPEAVYSIGRDPEGFRLALAYANAKTVEEYTRLGLAYRQWTYDNVSSFGQLYKVDVIWGASNKVSTAWKLGTGGARYHEAAIFR